MLSESDLERLRRGSTILGVTLTADQEDKLSRYVDVLLKWNAKLNLTAVTDPSGIVDKHLLDALALVPLLEDRAHSELVDVGTGPGLPTIVLAIALPQLRITAVESIHKKATFVRTVSRELGLDVAVLSVRLENLNPALRFDLAVSRATFEPTEWIDRGHGLVREGGLIAAMLSEHQNVPLPPPSFSALPVTEHDISGVKRRIAAYRRP